MKCSICPRKLTVKCNCDLVFCIKHLHLHNCSFDYFAQNKDKIKNENIKLIAKKFEKIN